jgi:thiaminase
MDELLEKRGNSPKRFDNLVKTFRKATTLEIGFWQMVLLLEP